MKPIIRCSSLSQLFKCHGVLTMLAKVAPRSGGESWEGSFIHWLVAKDLIQFLGAEGTIPDWPQGVPKDYKLPSKSNWLVNRFVVHTKENFPDDWSLQVETELRWEFPRFILVGHHDALGISPDSKKSHGADWKTVYNAVASAKDNDQVLGYLVLAFLNYNTDESSFDILQPRVKEEDGEQYSTVLLKRAQLEQAVAYLESAVNAALDDPMTTDSGPKQCAWCAAAMQCPSIELHRNLMKATITPELLARLKTTPDDALLSEIVIASKILSKSFEDAGEMIRERLATQQRINAPDGTSITMEIRKGQWSVLEGKEFEVYSKVHELLPPEAVAGAVKFSTEEIQKALARVRGVPQDGKSPVTGKKLFLEQIAPMLKQGEARVLKYA
jgi:hypothetical protein